MPSDPLLCWALYVLVGGLLLLAIFYLPERFLLCLGHYISPNWVSVIHTPIALIGYFALYRNGYLFWGVQLIIFGAALDRLDGRLASTLDTHAKPTEVPKTFWEKLNYKGGSPLGKIIDPLMDKLAVLPIYIAVAIRFVMGSELAQENLRFWLLSFGAFVIALIIIAELFGQILRMDYFDKWRHKKDNGATWAGKVKALAQWIWLIFFPIWDQGWLSEARWIYLLFLNLLLTGILGLACLSVLSKIRPLKESWTKTFSHNQ